MNRYSFQEKLAGWYRKNARDLLWRRTKDPYKIWVSETMLQQTQVKTVIPYYEKWIKRFPSVKALAEAPLSDVLRHWAGLGYYRRARMLHKAARYLYKNNPKANLPDNVEKLLEIPGIGRYTAGAIASIAFNKKVPVLDGNVIRVLSRLYAFKKDIGAPKAIQELWRISESLLPEKNPGDFNQALMELGATVCLPKNPACEICPVSDLCLAFRKGSVLKYPARKKKENLKTLRTTALIVRKKGTVLVRRQPLEGRWGGLWMFPFWKSKKMHQIRHCEPKAKQSGIKRDCFSAKGGSASGGVAESKTAPRNDNVLRHRMTIHHGFTKYRIRLDVYECNVGAALVAALKRAGTSPAPTSFSLRRGAVETRWINIRELPRLAFPSPHQKIAEDLIKNG